MEAKCDDSKTATCQTNKCAKLNGTDTCSCDPGYKLSSDGVSCAGSYCNYCTCIYIFSVYVRYLVDSYFYDGFDSRGHFYTINSNLLEKKSSI